MNRPPTPPSLALWLLSRVLPPQLRDCIIGDLEEERAMAGAGKLWFWKHSLGIILRFLWKRALEAGSRDSQIVRQPAIEQRKGDGMMETIWNNLRYAFRVLLKAPLFVAVCVATLALGLGANTAIFSVVNALLIRPLPLNHSESLVSMQVLNESGRRQYISFPDFQDLRARSHLFEGFSGFAPQSVNLTNRSEPQRVRGGFVSDNFFQLLDVQPAEGRGFAPGKDDKEGAERVCIVQYETWQNVFAGEANFIGKSIMLNNESFSVIGILPKGFRFPYDEVQVWIPYNHLPIYQAAAKDGTLLLRTAGMFSPIARVKSRVEFEQARKELQSIFQQLSKEHPEEEQNRLVRMKTLHEIVVSDVRPMVLVLFGAVIFVLLIACANVANLMLSRAVARQREMATRAALGAGRRHLVYQIFSEIGMLWAAGCTGGLLLGHWGLKLLMATAPEDLPGGIVASLDSTVFAFSLGLMAVTGLLFGLIPALRFSSPNVLDTLKEGGSTNQSHGHRTRLRAALVVGQLALTLVLLTGSVLMLRSFQELSKVNVGFNSEGLLTMEYRLPQNKYPEGAQQRETHKRIIDAVRVLPGVRSASLVDGLPFSGNGSNVPFEIPGKTGGNEKLMTRLDLADTDYFATMEIPVLRGRTFTAQDRNGSPIVVVINRNMAEAYWAGRDPIGQRVAFPDDTKSITAEIIGVVGNTKHDGLDEPDGNFVYLAQAQNPDIFNTIVVRTIGDPMQMANSVRAAVWSVDRNQPVWKVRTQQSLVEGSVGLQKFLAQLMACYAAVALLLATVGIYGVMSYTVTQRTYEIGVRMALGAEQKDVLRMVLRRGVILTCVGLILGIAGALALGRVVQSLLFHTNPSDPLTLFLVAGTLAFITLLASYLPARRATRVDPLSSLRYE